jgi:putative oxidoreductase
MKLSQGSWVSFVSGTAKLINRPLPGEWFSIIHVLPHGGVMTLVQRTARWIVPVIKGLDSLQPLIDLGVRLWVADVFWKSGVESLKVGEMTVDLFAIEFHVPLLSPYAAAVLGTGVELIFPVLLALGLAGRFSAGVLFIFNIMAVISYPPHGSQPQNHVGVFSD